MANCSSLGNTGKKGCPLNLRAPAYLWLFPYEDANQNVNEFIHTSGVTGAAIDTYIADTDQYGRMYPIGLFENATLTRAEAVKQTFDGGSSVKIRNGILSFAGQIPFEHFQLLARLTKWFGAKFGAMIVDIEGNILYKTDKSTKLKVQPIPINGNSWVDTMKYPTYTEAGAIMLMFDFDIAANDDYMRVIEATSLDFDALSKTGLLDATNAATASSTTAVQCVIKTTDYDQDVTGLVKADFTCYNVTDSAAVSITSVTESADGVYDFVIAAQTQGDTIRISAASGALVKGYDIADETCVIP